jgi:hypothetical protein
MKAKIEIFTTKDENFGGDLYLDKGFGFIKQYCPLKFTPCNTCYPAFRWEKDIEGKHYLYLCKLINDRPYVFKPEDFIILTKGEENNE